MLHCFIVVQRISQKFCTLSDYYAALRFPSLWYNLPEMLRTLIKISVTNTLASECLAVQVFWDQRVSNCLNVYLSAYLCLCFHVMMLPLFGEYRLLYIRSSRAHCDTDSSTKHFRTQIASESISRRLCAAFERSFKQIMRHSA